MQKIKTFIKSLELTWNDLFLAVGFLFSVIFYAYAWISMVTANPDDLFLKPWMIISCFSITAICWGIYFYLEIKAGRIKNSFSTWAYVFFLILSVVTVVIQPRSFSNEAVLRTINGGNEDLYGNLPIGSVIPVSGTISDTHVLLFAMGNAVITTIFYFMYFTISKRIRNIKFIVFIATVTFAFLICVVLYSYIFEWDHYIPFVKSLLGGDIEGVYEHSVCSFMAQRVPYGVCMMLGLVFALTVHAIIEKWQMYLLVAFFYFNMIFSYCKTSLIISAILVVLYVTFRLYKTYKDHPKRNKILIITFGSIIGLAVILTGLSYVTDGKFIPQLNQLVKSVTESGTIDSRSYIWDNTFYLLRDGWWIIGRGFGTYNMMLYPMNLVNGDNVCPSHSTYNAVLGAGGIFSLIGFLALIGYWVYLTIMCFKKDQMKTISMSFGAIGFIMYSFTEGVNYLVTLFLFPMFVLYHQLYKQEQ